MDKERTRRIASVRVRKGDCIEWIVYRIQSEEGRDKNQGSEKVAVNEDRDGLAVKLVRLF